MAAPYEEHHPPARQIQPGRVFLKYKAEEVEGECIILEISPVQFIPWRYTIFLLLNIFLAIPFLLTFWYPDLKRKFYYNFCTLEQATDFYILNYDEQVSIVPKEKKVFMIDEEVGRFYFYFVNRYMTYIIDESQLVRVSMYNYRERIGNIVRSKKEERGLSDCQAHELKNSYGPGTMVVERPSCVDLTVRQILRPLYLFLIFSVSYWTWALKYFYFAGVLFFISSFGLIVNLYQMIQLNNKIFSMAYHVLPVNVLREGKIEVIPSIDVVPGDIVFLKKQIKIPFEGILLEGSALINECALTGESVPIVKKADSFERMANPSLPIDKSAFVFEGTEIVQVNDKKKMAKFESFRERYGVPVCVVRTNFVTTKGQLIRIILFPKEQENIFQKESYKYLLFLFLLSVGTYIVLIILIHEYVLAEELVQRFFDLITITVPPALPVSMTFGIIYAVERLKEKGIFCIAQNKVITGGMIEFCCFDKTGTLTEDFMDFYALVPAENSKFLPAIQNNEPSINKMLESAATAPFFNTILLNMAANNSIVLVEETGELVGDPMEIKTFVFGRFQLNQSHSDPNVIFGFESSRGHSGLVYRRFEFDSDLQRMSVICKDSINTSKEECQVLAKGSPEMMATVMLRQSMPDNYQEILKQYASHGFRVLSIASKRVSQAFMSTMTREEAEKDLIFNGFEVFENKPKPESRGAIATLKAADIGCVMITGDNTLTGSNISYKCEISNKAKGMIICDFVEGRFTEENFDYQEDDEGTTDVSSKHPPPMESPDVLVSNSHSPAKKGLTIELEGTSNDKLDAESPRGAHKNYIEQISRKAQLNNCQLCVTGRAFNEIFSGPITELTPAEKTFMNSVSVFARTKPNDKAKIVMAFQHMDMKVSMCGDGANDCGALKQADIGLSLSQAEASISAPFTSQVTNISSIVELIKECRAGLATNFSLFNIMAIYSLIQYTTTVLSQKFLQYPADLQYLYWDLCLNFFFILFVGNTRTADRLSVERPRSSLFCATNLFQMIMAFGIQAAGQISIIAIFERVRGDFYASNGGMDNAKTTYDEEDGFSLGLEASIIFILSNNFYVITMIAFNLAKPWRERFFTNLPLVIAILVSLFYNQVLILWKEGSWVELISYGYLPDMEIRWIIFGVSWAFALFIWFLQKLVFEPLSNKLVKDYPQHKWL